MKNSINQSVANNNIICTFRLLVVLFLTSFLMLTSCQKEAIDELTPQSTEAIDHTETAASAKTNGGYIYPELTPELIEKANAEIQQLIKESPAPIIEGVPFSEDGKEEMASSRSGAYLWFGISSKLAGHKLDVRGGNLTNNTEIWQYTPNQTAAQIWSFHRTSGDYFYIKSKVSNKYLTVKNGSTAAKAPVVQHEYTPSLAYAQQWRLVESNTRGYYYFINRKSGMVLDVKWGSTANGTILWQYPFNGTDAQKFKYTRATYEAPRLIAAKGGNGGAAFTLLPPGGLIDAKKISRIFIRHGKFIDAVQVEWEMLDGTTAWSSRAGGAGGRGKMITLNANEYLIKITGRYGSLVDQLTFYTSSGRVFGPQGGPGGTAFSVSVSDGIKGFYGKSGNLLNKVGVIH